MDDAAYNPDPKAHPGLHAIALFEGAKGVLALGHQVNSKGYPYVAVVHPESCIGCAVCGRMCPDAAIEVYR